MRDELEALLEEQEPERERETALEVPQGRAKMWTKRSAAEAPEPGQPEGSAPGTAVDPSAERADSAEKWDFPQETWGPLHRKRTEQSVHGADRPPMWEEPERVQRPKLPAGELYETLRAGRAAADYGKRSTGPAHKITDQGERMAGPGGMGPSPQELDGIFRRDARRYDGDFPFY